MSTPYSRPPLVIPLSKWERSRPRLTEAAPIVLGKGSPNLESSSDAEPYGTPCAVCREHVSRYECPRCQAPYCSVGCYKEHSAARKQDGVEVQESSKCTEMFYKDRVTSVLRLEQQEQKGQAHKMLNAHFHKQRESQASAEELSDIDLHNILEFLDSNQKNVGNDLVMEEIRAILPPSVRGAFERALENGQLEGLGFTIWRPWWKRELSKAEKPTEIEHQAVHSRSSRKHKSLDERMLEVPQFRKMKEGASPNLTYDLISVLYGVSWTLRLYNGVDGARDLAVEAAETLISSSPVLSPTPDHYEEMEQVLMESTSASTRMIPSGCNSEWSVLVQDTADLICNKRHVARALFEAQDVLQSAVSLLKKRQNDDNAIKQKISNMRRLRKKLEYLLSWSLQNVSIDGDTGRLISEWIISWRHPDGDEDNIIIPEN